MTKVNIYGPVWVEVSRRSLCDNCMIDLCEYRGHRIFRCDYYRPFYIAFKKCSHCGKVFEVFSNFFLLDHNLCPECNELLLSCSSP